MVQTTVWIGGLLVLLLVLLALARRRTHRSWTDEEYERERNAGTALGNAFLATQAVLDPGAQHALEQRTVEEAEHVSSGAPPDPAGT